LVALRALLIVPIFRSDALTARHPLATMNNFPTRAQGLRTGFLVIMARGGPFGLFP
jgi:hypothetical protein